MNKLISLILMVPLLIGWFRGTTDIGSILDNPEKYQGQRVVVSGTYQGMKAEYGSPPVNRSDWVVKDDTGWIYVTGRIPRLNPFRDIGRSVTVYGTVMVTNSGQPYIRALYVSLLRRR